MTFQEADALMWQMLKLAFRQVRNRKIATVFKVSELAPIQEKMLQCIANDSYVTHFENNELKCFACYTLHPNKLISVHYAACEDSYVRTLVKLLREKTDAVGAQWYRAKTSVWHYFPSQRGHANDV